MDSTRLGMKPEAGSFRLLVDKMPVLVFVLNEDGIPVLWNKEAERVTGYSADEMIGQKNALEKLAQTPEDFWTRWKDFLGRGQHYRDWELPVRTRDGGLKTIAWSNVSGEFPIEGFWTWGIGVDVTARKQAEDLIRAGESRLRSIINRSWDGIALVDDQTHICEWNTGMERIVGLKRDDVIGKELVDIQYQVLAPDRRKKRTRENLRKVVQDTVNNPHSDLLTTTHDHEIMRPDGEIRYVQVSNFPLHEQPGLLFGAIFRDVTERVKAEQALRESESRLKEVANTLREAIWLRTREKILYISPAYEIIWGRPASEIYEDANAFAASIFKEDLQRVGEAHSRLYDEGATFDEEYRIVRPDGEIRWIHAHSMPVLDGKGKVIRTAGVAEDVTERHQTQQELLRTNRLAATTDLAGGLAHVINTLMAGILGNAELMKKEQPPDSDSQAMLDSIVRNAVRASSLAHQLVAFAGSGNLVPESCDINRLIRRISEEMQPRFPRLLKLEIDLDKDIWPIRVDTGQIRQALMAIVENSLEALSGTGRLAIRTENLNVSPGQPGFPPEIRTGKYVHVEVRDDGEGMIRDVLDRVFEPFFSTRSQDRGLGLSAVYGIMLHHDGHIRLDSEAGVGTTVHLFLPAVP